MDAAHRSGLRWAFVGVLLFSFSLPLTKVAIGGFDPYLTAMGRAVIAGSLAVTLLAIRRVPWPGRAQVRSAARTVDVRLPAIAHRRVII